MGRLQSPTVDLLLVFGVVFVVQQVAGVVGYGTAWFALATPLARPWTLVTSVYAHATVGHLLTNALALVLVGFALERYTTRVRFHVFVLVAGVVAGIGQLLVSAAVGTSVAVIGASGAVLALYGYVLVGNRVVDGLFSRVDIGRRATIAVIVIVALAVTLSTAGGGVALVAHFVGFVVGIVAGRGRVLRPA
jgi:membrane associated rhomboid family serine protease